MVAYFVALLFLGIPLMWIEWGIGRHGGRYRKGLMPGIFATLWHHPIARYLGVVGLVIPLTVLVYYTYIESWTLAYTLFLDHARLLGGHVRSGRLRHHRGRPVHVGLRPRPRLAVAA